MTLKELAQEAIDFQFSGDLAAVVQGFSRAIIALPEALMKENRPNGKDAINNHPICKLWSSKCFALTQMGIVTECPEFDPYCNAYEQCKRLADSDTNKISVTNNRNNDTPW